MRVPETGRVLVVDDEELNRELMFEVLRHAGCQVVTACNCAEAIASIAAAPPDVLLLDVMMPGMNGFELCVRLRADPVTSMLPIVMVSGLGATTDRIRSLEAGADDYLTKPVDRDEIVARVRSLLRMKHARDGMENAEQVVFTLARAVDARSPYTEAHSIRVARMAWALGHAAKLSPEALADLYRGTLIHDIGKIGLPDRILAAGGSLNEEDMALIRQHPSLGAEIIAPLRAASALMPIVRHHHERLDGAGYPDRLAGDQIPVAARIVAICDGFDALVSDRPSRRGLTLGQARAAIQEGAGTLWDPDLVALFKLTDAWHADLEEASDAATGSGRRALRDHRALRTRLTRVEAERQLTLQG